MLGIGQNDPQKWIDAKNGDLTHSLEKWTEVTEVRRICEIRPQNEPMSMECAASGAWALGGYKISCQSPTKMMVEYGN